MLPLLSIILLAAPELVPALAAEAEPLCRAEPEAEPDLADPEPEAAPVDRDPEAAPDTGVPDMDVDDTPDAETVEPDTRS